MQTDIRDALLSDVYDELRAAAARMLRRDAAVLTLQPTDLVNEAALKVIGLNRISYADRRHMFATCSRVLRQTMIDEIRRKRASKRLAPEVTVMIAGMGRDVDIEELDDLLERLEAVSPVYAQVVDMRFFAGLTLAEIATTLGVSEPTVKRRWQAARAWLAGALHESTAGIEHAALDNS